MQHLPQTWGIHKTVPAAFFLSSTSRGQAILLLVQKPGH